MKSRKERLVLFFHNFNCCTALKGLLVFPCFMFTFEMELYVLFDIFLMYFYYPFRGKKQTVITCFTDFPVLFVSGSSLGLLQTCSDCTCMCLLACKENKHSLVILCCIYFITKMKQNVTFVICFIFKKRIFDFTK